VTARPGSARSRRGALAALAVLLAATAGATPAPRPGVISSWVTSADGSRRLDPAPAVRFGRAAARPTVVEVDPDLRYQAWLGVGAAITDSSAIVLEQDLAPEPRAALLAELFGPPPGLGLSLTRVTIGASDFSARHYSLDDPPDGTPDPTLAHYASEPAEAPVLPLVQRARALNPALEVFAAPWSAPAWMKDSGRLITGQLRPDAYPAFADYLLRFVDSYARAGVPLYALTVQNEPANEPRDYPGMRFEAADRARFIAEALGPRLAARPDAPRLLDWDHNWDKPEQPLAVLDDPAAARYVSGVAWHCYARHVSAQSRVHDLHPDKDAFLTECSGGAWSGRWHRALRFFTGTVLIGAARNWARGVILWNLALDERGGPHRGGCRTCRGIVTIDSITGEVTRNPEYYALAHVSRFVRPGAVRIESTSVAGGLRTVAFRNGDGSIVLVVCNDGDDAEFSVRMRGRTAPVSLPGGAVATLTWTPPR
jgi:glucosylceramidase